MEGLTATPIPLPVRIELCRAGMQITADRLGVRMLHIKGAALDPAVRAQRRHGSDVDVIVDPAKLAVLHEALSLHGWAVYSTYEDGSPFGHAQTYWHPDWGYVDLHRRFPGIGLADREAFEVLWTGHGAATAAGLRIVVPSVRAQGVLHLLNAARGGQADREEASRYRASLSVEERRELDALIDALDAGVAASVVTDDLEHHRGRREYRLWKAISQGGTRSQEWWARVLAARTPREAMRVIVNAPRVNRSRLAHQLGRRPTRRDVFTAGMDRARMALRELTSGREVR